MCSSDSGSPLYVDEMYSENLNFKKTVVGLASLGYGCTAAQYPVLFTRVSNYLDWIEINK